MNEDDRPEAAAEQLTDDNSSGSGSKRCPSQSTRLVRLAEEPRSAALAYAAEGRAVLPLHSAPSGRCSCGKDDCDGAGKHPRTAHGLTDATTDDDVIEAWWAKWPTANIGVATGRASGLLVLDVDPRHGGIRSLAHLERIHGRLPQGPCALTGSGGHHHYFADPDGTVRNSAGVLGDGLDIRGEGGYVVAPPSVGASGNAYKWLPHRSLEESSLVVPPSWMLELLSADKRGNGRAAPIADTIPEGRRNVELASLAGTMRRRNVGENAILAALKTTNAERCKPPLPDAEVEKIAESVSRYPPPSETEQLDSADGTKGPSQATRLVRLAEERFRLGRTTEGDLFAVPKVEPALVRMLRGSGSSLRAVIAHAYAAEYDTAPASASISSALSVLEGAALQAKPEPLALRVGEHDGRVVIDLGDDTGRTIVVGPTGWEVVSVPPILFRRTALTSALPEPVRGGSLEELRDLVHLTEEAWELAVGWLVLSLMADLPVPILWFRGAQGSGKSSAARFFSRLVDPSPAQLRSVPRDPAEWTMTASVSRVVTLDNLSTLKEWFGDALCRSVTGEGQVRRQLYTDSDAVVFSFKRAVVLTGITLAGVRDDLADRMLPVELERIDEAERRTEAELEAAFAEAHPRILGALLDVVAQVLQVFPEVKPERLPRLADAGRVYLALDRVRGGQAFETFCGVAGQLAHEVVEDDPVADAVRTLVADRGHWEGTAQQLLTLITPEDKPRGWPESPRALSGRLTRNDEALRRIGVQIERGHTGNGVDRRRFVRITAEREVETSYTSSASSQMSQQSHLRANDGGERWSDNPGSRSNDVNDVNDGRTMVETPSSAPSDDSTMRDRVGGSNDVNDVNDVNTSLFQEKRGFDEEDRG